MAEPASLSSIESARSWVAAVINHGDYEAAKACIASLGRQTLPPRDVFLYDTGEDSDAYRVLVRSLGPRSAHVSRGPNLGYAGAANFLLRVVEARRPETAYVLLLNPDVELDPRFAEELVGALDGDPRAAMGSGKLLRPGRERIDSAGIELPRHRRPRDRGAEQPDRGQFDRAEHVFAVSGAALMLRRAALPALAIEGEIFDEDFFVYHEDTDLGWRAGRLGWAVLYWPGAVAVHGRAWRRSARFSMPAEARRHSFKNHYLQMLKNEGAGDFIRNLPWLLGWECLRLGYSVLRDRAVLGGYRDAWRLRAKIWRKRRALERALATLGAAGIRSDPGGNPPRRGLRRPSS